MANRDHGAAVAPYVPILPSHNAAADPASLSRLAMLKLGFFIFVSTTPGLGQTAALAGTAIGTLIMFTMIHKPSQAALRLLMIFFVTILPLTIFDLVYSIQSDFVTMSFLVIPFFIIAGFVLSQSTGEMPYIFAFERVFFFLAVPSFVLFLVILVFPSLAYNLPEYDYQETTHRTALILNVLMNPDPVLRNSGFASEPGFYQILVNLALYARMQRLGKPDRICLFYLVVVFSTLSTTGIAVALFLISIKFDLKYRLFIFVFIILFFGAAQAFFLDQYESKFLNDSVFGGRFRPSLNAFYFFLDNPLGIGAFEYTLIFDRFEIGSYDSYTQIALRYGIGGLFGFAMLLTSLGRRYSALLGVFLLSFITSPVWFIPVISACYFRSRPGSVNSDIALAEGIPGSPRRNA